MNSKIPCSVGILTFNSASTLARALESVKDFEQIIICDGGSTDNTLSIAKKYGCTIISQSVESKNADNTIKDFSMVRNQCLDAAKFEWFLYIDSDEAASNELVGEVKKIVAVPTTSYIYKVPIRIYIGGHLIKYSSNYPGYQARFFNRASGARFEKNVHERIVYNMEKFPAAVLYAPWYVFMTEDEANNYLTQNIAYAKKEALRHRGISFISYIRWIFFGSFMTVLKILVKTLINYVLHGFRDTMPFAVEWGRVRYAVTVFWLITQGLCSGTTI